MEVDFWSVFGPFRGPWNLVFPVLLSFRENGTVRDKGSCFGWAKYQGRNFCTVYPSGLWITETALVGNPSLGFSSCFGPRIYTRFRVACTPGWVIGGPFSVDSAPCLYFSVSAIWVAGLQYWPVYSIGRFTVLVAGWYTRRWLVYSSLVLRIFQCFRQMAPAFERYF